MIDTLQNYPTPMHNACNGSHGPTAPVSPDGIAGAIGQTVEAFLRRSFGEKYLDAGNLFGVYAKLATYALLLILAFAAFLAQIKRQLPTGRESGPNVEKEV